MNWLKENWFKVTIALTILLVGLSFFYYNVIFLPQKEQTRIETEKTKEEQLKQDALAKEEKVRQEKAQAQLDLETCLSEADSSYSDFWLSECDAKGLLSTQCKKYVDVYNATSYFNKYPSEKSTSTLADVLSYLKKRSDCSCLLPQYNADRAEELKQNNKTECYKKYSVQ